MCKCSGHCYVSCHRYRGCTALDLLPASEWCPQCACTVRGCGSPRLHSPLCAGHKGEWEEGPLEFVLTRCARKALPWLMPCDITDFVNLYPRVRHDKAFVIIIALLQEPRAIASFVEKAMALAPAYSVNDLAAVLLETLDDIGSPTLAHRMQIQALSQQGPGRCVGVASMCLEWGLIEPAEEQEESEAEETAKTRQRVPPRKRRRRMRAKGRIYRRTGANERLCELLRASRVFRRPPEIVDSTTFEQTVSWAEAFDQFLGSQSRTWVGQVGYVHDFLRRKFVLGQLSSSSGRTNVQWSEVSVDCLKQVSPDACGYLSRVPAKWNAADLSRFCTDRDDWGILASMFA